MFGEMLVIIGIFTICFAFTAKTETGLKIALFAAILAFAGFIVTIIEAGML